jgi:hypothetical protein
MKRLTQILVIGALARTIWCVPLVAVLTTLASAQVPQMINYQGKLTDADGKPTNDTLQMVFSIYADSIGGTALWDETQTSVIVEKGVFSVLLGSATPGGIPDTVFDGSVRYLGVKVGGDQDEILPRKPIVSVAYAYKSMEADTADYARAGAGGGGDNDWAFRLTDGNDTTLITGGAWGIARHGNVLYGNADSTHANLGVACTTGTSGQNYKYCTVGGGLMNTASGNRATVGGGHHNTASGSSATVGGGSYNTASKDLATVGGGSDNTASEERATVGGGFENTASGWDATVGGGVGNTASSDFATVSGGGQNTASNYYATVGGGTNNTASGEYATVAGGYTNTVAGDKSFAAGINVTLTSTADYTFAFGNGFTTSASHAVIFHDTETPIKVGIGTTSPQRALHISDVMRLEPRASAPASPSEGDIYVNSTDHHIYCYLNGVWKQLDN